MTLSETQVAAHEETLSNALGCYAHVVAEWSKLSLDSQAASIKQVTDASVALAALVSCITELREQVQAALQIATSGSPNHLDRKRLLELCDVLSGDDRSAVARGTEASLQRTATSPLDVQDAREAIMRMCSLQAKVCQDVIGYDGPRDCFCGRSGFWPLNAASDYRNDMAAIGWIEDVVREAIERHDGTTGDVSSPPKDAPARFRAGTGETQ